MAVIISSHRRTVAMMNSIHTLLSENHPCTSFMASLRSGHPRTQYTITSTDLEPYSFGNGTLSASRDHHSSAAENRRTKSGFSFANGECVTHMRQGFPVQRLFAAPLRTICPSALTG